MKCTSLQSFPCILHSYKLYQVNLQVFELQLPIDVNMHAPHQTSKALPVLTNAGDPCST